MWSLINLTYVKTCIAFFLFQVGKRGPPPLKDDLHRAIYRILDGHTLPKAERSVEQNTAYRKIRKHKLKLKRVTNPLTKKPDVSITYQDLIVPNQSAVKAIANHFHQESHGDGARKLEMKIRQYYTGGFTNWIMDCQCVRHRLYSTNVGEPK